ncbi:ribosomal protein S18-alanine N-acetyltransferase [Alkaliphilus sp. MSJ-5]|uniref:[Ribosomal protein bS18]-alanine N-acetyltransferase n=1 Tax=Alkaliphilus flagellatus TaxID=2841507 RepID=A0ABS6G2M8_9FIRM|nr:ribosomal protein S18-alanine N-acetyltransferase [Alkaliphilus flagellatus]MBU5676719.1 ribosomal protein S18-alanine N-acetyltransferase [Alkaliphilus flagellatus]
MESIIVRKMELGDIDSVLDIEENSFSIPWTRNAFVTELKKNKLAKYLVAEVDGDVAAYGGMWLVVDEAHITNIAVHPRYRGRGVGKKIVEGLIGEGQKINIYRMTLEVRRSNLTAQGLYKKLGFIPCGIRPGYYQDNYEDALIMWKDLV